MTPSKRAFDIIFASGLLILCMPFIALISLIIYVFDGAPVFYVSERMQTPDRGFSFLKFRTMKPAQTRDGVTGGDKVNQITQTGHFLRRTHLDELPQLWNVVKGDISLVGPRAPLRLYVEACPDLYRQVLQARPGITGLATLQFAAREVEILANCKTPAETHTTYLRRCVPRKARLDIVYAENRSLCWDMVIIFSTFGKVLGKDPRNRVSS